MEWIIMIGLVIAMYIIIYKYEKKMDKLHEMIEENKNNIEQNKEKLEHHHEKINKNKTKLNEHSNHIEQMWVTIPKSKLKDEES